MGRLNEVTSYKSLSYKQLTNLSYWLLVNYLLRKYGFVLVNYFTDQTETTRNWKINSRTNAGLMIHPMDENKVVCLTVGHSLWEFQKSYRPVYCNLLEHLLLHIKI